MQDGKRAEGYLSPPLRQHFRHFLPSSLSCSARRVEIRLSIKGRRSIQETTHGKSLLLLLSSDFIGSSLVDVWLQTFESTSVGCRKDGRYHTFFSSSFISFHFAPNNFPISPTRGTRFFCDQHKEVKADRQRMTRAYRNRHLGSRP